MKVCLVSLLFKHKNFIKLYHYNASLRIFCEQLDELPENGKEE